MLRSFFQLLSRANQLIRSKSSNGKSGFNLFMAIVEHISCIIDLADLNRVVRPVFFPDILFQNLSGQRPRNGIDEVNRFRDFDF